MSTHFVHSENLLVARIHEPTSKSNPILIPMLPTVHKHTHSHST
jgi:hypothetical protein